MSRMCGSGIRKKKTKTKSGVWKYFELLDERNENGSQLYLCKFCKNPKAKYIQHATRQARHLVSCLMCPASVKKEFIGNSPANSKASCSAPSTSTEMDFESEDDSVIEDDARSISSSSLHIQSPLSSGPSPSTLFSPRGSFDLPATPTPTPKPIPPRKIGNFIDTISSSEHAELEELFSRAIYASGTPLSITENIYWKTFLNKLRPAFSLPSRYSLSQPLLEKELARVELEVETKLAGATCVALQCDGWSNIRNEAIVNFIITTPSPIFYKSLATKSERHTGEYLAEVMMEVMEKVGSKKFLAMVTDNAAAMVKAQKIVQEDPRFEHVAGYGCAAHTLNLLVGDIMKLKSLHSLQSQCKAIVTEVNMSQVIRSTFTDIQIKKNILLQKPATAISLKLPVKTRWGSIIFCLRSLLDTKYALKQLAVVEELDSILDKAVKATILDDSIFWVRVQATHDLLKPIVSWITRLEGDDPKISNVPQAFSEIAKSSLSVVETAPLTKKEEELVIEAIEKRANMAMREIHYAANILDPSRLGQDISEDQLADGIEYIDKLVTSHPMFSKEDSVNILVEIAHFREKDGFWGKPYIWKTAGSLNPLTWWKAICKSSSLRTIAIAILGMPPTSAATERSFSKHALVHSSKRNRLTTERAGKLVYVSHNLKLLKIGPQLQVPFRGLGHDQPNPNLSEISEDSDSSSDAICTISDDDDV